jgi:hypothetical protein
LFSFSPHTLLLHLKDGTKDGGIDPGGGSGDGQSVIVQEETIVVKTEKKTTVIPRSFYLYNDFVCSSVNKWLHRIIPVR